MGWDSNSHILLTAPISLEDISWAAGIGGPPYDLGYMLKNGLFNKYAKKKPVSWNSVECPSDAILRQMDYGLTIDETLHLSATTQDPYWNYSTKRPVGRPTDWFRALDLDGYKANAEAPLLVTGNIYDSTTGRITIDMRNGVMNRSQNVELALDDMISFASQDYFGFILWDTTRQFGYKLITDVIAQDVVDGTIPQGVWSNFAIDVVQQLPFLNNDVVEFFWATCEDNTMVYDPSDPDGRLTFVRLSSGDQSGYVTLVACDQSRGHMNFQVQKLDLSQIVFTGANTAVAGMWNGSSSWSITQFRTRFTINYSWPRSAESYQFHWDIRDNSGNTIFFLNPILSAGNASSYYDLALSVGQGRTWSIYELIDDDYVITLDLYGGFPDSGVTKRFATIYYNVQTGATSWTIR